jgi:hypothetical protein
VVLSLVIGVNCARLSRVSNFQLAPCSDAIITEIQSAPEKRRLFHAMKEFIFFVKKEVCVHVVEKNPNRHFLYVLPGYCRHQRLNKYIFLFSSSLLGLYEDTSGVSFLFDLVRYRVTCVMDGFLHSCGKLVCWRGNGHYYSLLS